MAQATPEITQGTGPTQLPEGGASEVNSIPNTVSADAGAAAVATGAQEAGQQPTSQQPAPQSGGGPAADQSAPPPQPQSVLGVPPQATPEAPVTYSPQSEEEQYLFGPPDGTTIGAVQPGASLKDGPMQPPPEVLDALPSLQMAAMDPTASPQVKALYTLVAYHAGQQ